MSVIVFPNSSLSSIACAQFLLDGQPSLSIHLISNSFEVGLMRETPGLITNDQWPLVRPHWLSEHGLDAPAGESTAIRASWLTKSMAISLSERGATFHTGSRILETNEESKTIHYDVIIEMPDPTPKREWRGAVCSEVPDWAVSSGRRTDGTYEFWWTGTEEPVNAIQTMSWMGPSPSTALLDAITEASRASDTILTGSMPA